MSLFSERIPFRTYRAGTFAAIVANFRQYSAAFLAPVVPAIRRRRKVIAPFWNIET
jgi:hypothetical protein